MTDFRRRLGLLVPSADVVAEPDFQRFLPDGIVIYTSRAFQRGPQTVSNETLRGIVEATDEAAESLSHARPEIICFACTAASFMHGPGWDGELAERISRAAGGIPALTTSGALIAAMTALDLRKVFMVTPYPEARNEVERNYFAASGIDIVGHTRFDCRMGWEIPAIAPEQIVERAMEHRDAIGAAGGLFLTCTNLRSMEVAEDLERALDVPVVTSNSAALWAALSGLGVDAGKVRAGRLFGSAPAADIPRVA